jgi:hypothetical protein
VSNRQLLPKPSPPLFLLAPKNLRETIIKWLLVILVIILIHYDTIMTMPKIGKVIESTGCNIRTHERKTAQALATIGLVVEFVLTSKQDFTKSPDLFINGECWEIKSPKTSNLKQIEKNLKLASKQSTNIILDSQRVKNIPDKKIQAFLISRFKSRRFVIKKLLFINRNRRIVDISKLV